MSECVLPSSMQSGKGVFCTERVGLCQERGDFARKKGILQGKGGWTYLDMGAISMPANELVEKGIDMYRKRQGVQISQ